MLIQLFCFFIRLKRIHAFRLNIGIELLFFIKNETKAVILLIKHFDFTAPKGVNL